MGQKKALSTKQYKAANIDIHYGQIKLFGKQIALLSAVSSKPSPSDLFSNLKKWLIEKRMNSNDKIIALTNYLFDDLGEPYYLEGIKKFGGFRTKIMEPKRVKLRKRNVFVKSVICSKSHGLLNQP